MVRTLKRIATIFVLSLMITTDALAIPVDENTEFIPAPKNLGIGTFNPRAKLEVNGQVLISGGNPSLNAILTSDADGLASWESLSSLISNVNIFTGNFIGNGSALTGLDAANISGTFNPANVVISQLDANDGDPKAALVATNDGTLFTSQVLKFNSGTRTFISADTNHSDITASPQTDAFRLRRDNTFFNNNGGDAFIIEKTDANGSFPDGGIAFVNTGIDGNGGAISSTAMVIRGSGNVGIGTEKPAAKLHVNGDLIVDGSFDNPNNPWVLVHSEDFEGSVTGWSDNRTSLCGGHQILGGANISNAPRIKSFDLSAIPHSHVMLKFNYYSIDTWDAEEGYAAIDGLRTWTSKEIIFNDYARHPSFGGRNLCGHSNYNEQVMSGEARIDHTDDNLTVEFGFAHNGSPPSDESYGVDNLEIWVKKANPTTTTLSTSPGASDNAGCGADGFYRPVSGEVTSGGGDSGHGSGPSTADFSQCDKVLYVDGGHSVTRTWNFTSPPRSGQVTLLVQKRRSSSGPGLWYWFQNNIQISNVDQSRAHRISTLNADISYICNYTKSSDSYSCSSSIQSR